MTDLQLETSILMENFEMLKALYDFTAVYPKTISFDEGEYFIMFQTSHRQRNWWQVVSMKGNIGFVPSNYVMKLKVEPEFLIGFLDSSIESLKLLKDEEINGIISRKELLKNLEEKKQIAEVTFLGQNSETDQTPSPKEEKKHIGNGSVKNIEVEEYPVKEQTKKMSKKSLSSPAVTQLPQLINESPSMSVLTSKLEDITISIKKETHDNSITSEPSEPTTTTTTTTTGDDITTVFKLDDSKIDQIDEEEIVSEAKIDEVQEEDNEIEQLKSPTTPVRPKIDHQFDDMTPKIEEQDVYQVIDSIRQNTNLSHELSCVALRVVLSELEALLPQQIVNHLEPIAAHLSGPLSAPDNLLGQTHDAQRLRIIFSDLADCKNDSQQRTWMLYEDEDDISRYLKELIGILTNADPKICRHEMSCDQYQSIVNLVLYYQMETRWSIRKMLLEAFKSMCHLDFTAVDILLSSVLPIELVEDMKSNMKNLERLKSLAEMLTMIFSIGQKMPVTYEETLGVEFVTFVLNIIETTGSTDNIEQLSDVMINLLLSFNLQFDDFNSNAVVESMKQLQSAKTFTEKILLLINREEDPACILKHTPPPANSVLKMFVDLYSTVETADLFYTNDNKVLIDILVRQLSDLSPGDHMRRWYLELCRRILRNTNYTEHTHRKQDLMKIFTRIFCEETQCSAKDQQLVREIANEFPQIFKA